MQQFYWYYRFWQIRLGAQTLGFYLSGGAPRGPDVPQRFIAARDSSEAQRFRDGVGLVDFTYVGNPTPFARSIADVRLALLFREIAGGRIKVSFRSVGEVDVAKLAERFAGGGHRKAAGASLEGTLADVQERVLTAARELLDAQTS